MTVEQQKAKIIVDTALEFMANKAGVSISQIADYIATNETGASYFADLIKIGMGQ